MLIPARSMTVIIAAMYRAGIFVKIKDREFVTFYRMPENLPASVYFFFLICSPIQSPITFSTSGEKVCSIKAYSSIVPVLHS